MARSKLIPLTTWLDENIETDEPFSRFQIYRMCTTGILRDVAVKVGTVWMVPKDHTLDRRAQREQKRQADEDRRVRELLDAM